MRRGPKVFSPDVSSTTVFWTGHTDIYAVAEHTLTQDRHKISFEYTHVLATSTNYYRRIYREAIEKQKYPLFNRKEDITTISRTWTHAIRRTKRLEPKYRMTLIGLQPTKQSYNTKEIV